MATLKLKDENFLEDWKAVSEKINADFVGVDGFISRDSLRGKDGLIYCIIKWETEAKQEKFMTELMSQTEEERQKMFAEFERIVDIQSMTKKILKVL